MFLPLLGLFILFVILIACVIFLTYIIKDSAKGDSTHPTVSELKTLAAKIDPKYENLDLRVSDIATTLDKQTIVLCVDDPETGRPYSKNTLMGVLIHELAHYESESYGEHENDHNQEWKDNYKIIFQKAVETGVYNPRFPPPNSYCKIL